MGNFSYQSFNSANKTKKKKKIVDKIVFHQNLFQTKCRKFKNPEEKTESKQMAKKHKKNLSMIRNIIQTNKKV